MFLGFILFRILLLIGLIFIVGYVFGDFSKNKALSTITKVSTLLLLTGFLISSVFMFRFGGPRHFANNKNRQIDCPYFKKEPTAKSN